MRPAAEIQPFALFVDGDLLVARQIFNNLHFVVLTHIAKDFDRLVSGTDDTLDCQVVRSNFRHALLNILKIFKGKVMARGKVVIKAVFDRRANGDLCTGK